MIVACGHIAGGDMSSLEKIAGDLGAAATAAGLASAMLLFGADHAIGICLAVAAVNFIVCILRSWHREMGAK